MTCADLISLDAEMATGMIFYIAGYSDGQTTMLAASGPADSEAGPSQSGETEEAVGTGGQSADAKATVSEEEETAAAANSTADASGAGGEGNTAGPAGEATGGLGISVEQVRAACDESPDSPASEVIKVMRGATQPDIEPQDEDPAAEGEDGQDVGSGNAVVE
jgi:hypothetical protein